MVGPQTVAETGSHRVVLHRRPGLGYSEFGGITMADQYAIRLSIERVENGQYVATSRDLSRLVAQGRTIAETIEIAQDVARKLIESYMEHGDPIPSSL